MIKSFEDLNIWQKVVHKTKNDKLLTTRHSPLILGCDTSLGVSSVAITDGSSVLSFCKNETRGNQAETLFYMIEKCLKESGISSYSDLDALAVTTGPGSFTGLRVGLAAIRGISLSANLPVIGVTTNEIILWDYLRKNPERSECVVISAIKAGKGQVYLQFSNCKHGVEDPKIKLVEYVDVLNYCKPQPATHNLIIIGNAGTELTQFLPDECQIINLTTSAEAVAIYGSINCDKKKDGNKITPTYIRLPDAKPQHCS